jgi:hypothetical protein
MHIIYMHNTIKIVKLIINSFINKKLYLPTRLHLTYFCTLQQGI